MMDSNHINQASLIKFVTNAYYSVSDTQYMSHFPVFVDWHHENRAASMINESVMPLLFIAFHIKFYTTDNLRSVTLVVSVEVVEQSTIVKKAFNLQGHVP